MFVQGVEILPSQQYRLKHTQKRVGNCDAHKDFFAFPDTEVENNNKSVGEHGD